jgi:hypothetical protein
MTRRCCRGRPLWVSWELGSGTLTPRLEPPEGTVTAAFADQEIWHVLVASDDMKRMNVDQLDDAFRLDVVDASTLVWKTGMSTWRRLGSIAGIDEEESQTITKQMMPADILRLMPPPPPPPRPAPSVMPKAPKPPRPLHAQAPQPAAPVFKTQQFAAPLMAAPLYVPTLHAPDPYVLPKRRVSVPSEVDFRRKSGGVRLGRWVAGLLIVTAGVLVCYRQNLLREGARRLGLENKYLYGEKRAVDYVSAKAPRPLQNALRRLALLPGPNAMAATLTKPEAHAAAPIAAAAPVAAAAAVEPAKAVLPADDVKTVSLDSLPVLAAEATEPATARAAAVAPAALATPKASPPKAVVASKPVASKPIAKAEKPKRQAEAEEAPAPKPKKAEPEPKPVVAKEAPTPPPSGNESFLKAAIRSAIAADASKGK